MAKKHIEVVEPKKENIDYILTWARTNNFITFPDIFALEEFISIRGLGPGQVRIFEVKKEVTFVTETKVTITE